MHDGFPVEAFIPFLKQFPELFVIRTQLHDNYAEFYQYLGIGRSEMMSMMRAAASVDVLAGIDNLEYAE